MSRRLRDSAKRYCKKALSLKQKGKTEEALKSLLIAEETAQKAEASDVLLPIMSIKGELLLSLGVLDEALRVCIVASNFLVDFLSKDPENEIFQQSLQMNLNNIGTVGYSYYNAGRFPQAKKAYETGLDISLKLLQFFPQDNFLQYYTGAMFNDLGALLWNMGRIEDAKNRYEKALEMRKKLLENDPENVAYQSYVAMTLNNLGLLFWNMGRIEDAKNRYEKTLEIYTEPMQYLTIGRKSESIIRLIELNSEQAEEETNPFDQMNYLRDIFQLCKKNREFFVEYELNHERKLVTEAGLSAYIDFLMMLVKLENNPEKRAEEYEKALQAVEKLEEIEENETISRLCSSAACYLRGRKLVNEALASREPELELLRQAVEQFKSAKETYDRANVCFCVYTGLLNILEDITELEEIDVPKLKELVRKVIENLPEDINPNIMVSFENIPQIFEEKDKMTRKELLKKLDERISIIEYKALENIFGHINEKIKDYFEEPFSPNLIYENWKLKVKFDDPEKVKGKLTVKAGNKIIYNRALSKEETKRNLLEIDYLKAGYFPKGEDEITFTTSGHKKPVMRSIDYFESINRDVRTRILLHDCCDKCCIDGNLRIAAVQLKYHGYNENSVVIIKTDEAYHRKVITVLEALKGKTDIIVFPEFSIPFDYLEEIQQFADDNNIIVVAGSHYVVDENLKKYEKLFARKFEEEDLLKNISPVVIPSSKIVHNEKHLGARIEEPVFFEEGMEPGKINHIFKFREKLNIGVMICYEFINTEMRHRLVPICNVILVPQTNPKPRSFYDMALTDINRPLGGGNTAFVMANGIFTVDGEKKIQGGSTGIALTLDKHSKTLEEEGIISPVGGAMEQVVFLASINTDFFPAWESQVGQVPIRTKLIHIFEETEILNNPEGNGADFIKLINKINSCENREELRELLEKNRRDLKNDEDADKGKKKSLIEQYSPLMNKHIQNIENLKLDQMKKRCCSILIPSK
ncbi:MAG: tetratricopeptide repeat protein [Euryarchaeota archaeon]|nr:tetratricopeptide repeat protein [Euryarchaeota archaeon]